MRSSYKTFATLVSGLLLGALAQASNYQFVTSHQNIDIYVSNDKLSNGSGGSYYEVTARVVNNTQNKARVRFRMRFVCLDGTVDAHDSGIETTLEANQTQSGEGAGLWYRACHDTAPASAEVYDFSVSFGNQNGQASLEKTEDDRAARKDAVATEENGSAPHGRAGSVAI